MSRLRRREGEGREGRWRADQAVAFVNRSRSQEDHEGEDEDRASGRFGFLVGWFEGRKDERELTFAQSRFSSTTQTRRFLECTGSERLVERSFRRLE